MRTGLVLNAAVVLGLAACALVAPKAEPPSGPALYAEYCVVCHGPGGKGDGILADDLPKRPSDLTGLSARNGGTFPWSDVMAQIHGYKGRSDVMPEFGTVLEGATVEWTDETGATLETPVALLALAEYLAELQDGGV